MPYQGGFMIILTGWQWVHNMAQQTEHKILEKISKDEYKYHEKNFDQTDTVKLNQDGAKDSHFRDLITTWNYEGKRVPVPIRWHPHGVIKRIIKQIGSIYRHCNDRSIRIGKDDFDQKADSSDT